MYWNKPVALVTNELLDSELINIKGGNSTDRITPFLYVKTHLME
jgi:hypothetical protein